MKGETSDSMKTIVFGCGKIGEALVEALVAEGHDVLAIDADADVISQITNVYDVIGVCGNGADCDTLEDAGIRQTGLFIAVTGSDELNMLSCFLARRMGARHTIARIRNPEYNASSLDFLKKELQLSLAINPELLAARELFDILKIPSAEKIDSFSGRSFELVQLRVKEGSPLDGLMLSDLRSVISPRVLICTVQRGDDVTIPGASFVLKAGDRIGVSASPSEIDAFLRQAGLEQKQVRSVMILGGSRTAYYLARMLAESGTAVKIIERDAAAAEELSEALPGVSIVRGDGVQQELLLEEGLKSADAFIALTGMDETNILISIFASSQNVPKVIAKINRNELSGMAERLGLECVVSPKKLISDILTQYARALENSRGSSVETLYKLMDDRVEALEFNAQSTPGLTEIPLVELKSRLKKGTLIAGIIRGRKTLVPGGNDCIMPGDRVIVLTEDRHFSDLSDILQ